MQIMHAPNMENYFLEIGYFADRAHLFKRSSKELCFQITNTNCCKTDTIQKYFQP